MAWDSLVIFCIGIYLLLVAVTLYQILHPGHRQPAVDPTPSWLLENQFVFHNLRLHYYSYIPNEVEKICVLQHGLGDCSAALFREAALLKDMGFGVLMMDFPGHGKSARAATTFGRKESRALHAIIQHLSIQERIKVMWGRSAGAATVLYLSSSLPSCKALLLDCMFDSEIKSASRYSWAVKKYWPLVFLTPMVFTGMYFWRRSGWHVPINEIGKTNLPILLITGNRDIGAGPSVQKSLYARLKNSSSQLRLLDGPGHNQCFAQDSKIYENWLAEACS